MILLYQGIEIIWRLYNN